MVCGVLNMGHARAARDAPRHLLISGPHPPRTQQTISPGPFANRHSSVTLFFYLLNGTEDELYSGLLKPFICQTMWTSDGYPLQIVGWVICQKDTAISGVGGLLLIT
ncbi:hypothetical protein CDAR_119001 [Caerostris darwini]|uniref:Uncharacterized protein n=1 Tax=Caerostris darwini TaxID=1538125 RepID=A0AAV4VAZ2_9ARAC|nr:hypothetical protein CDAR_119001 [Caerostris darwini]